MRVGIVGTNWGRMHVGAFRGAGATVTALCGRDVDQTRGVAAEEGVPLGTSDFGALCEACEVVVVASPDRLHAAHVREALERGRHVLCEKPLAFTVDEARALAVLGGTGKRAVCFPYRFLPPMVALRGWLEGRRVQALTVSVRNSFAAAAGRENSGDFSGCSHLVDAACWLARAQPLVVRASAVGQPPSSVTFSLELERGGFASITQLAAAEPGMWGEWKVVGEGWEAQVAGGYRPERGGWCIGPARVFEGEWKELSPQVTPDEPPEPWARAHVETARAFLQHVGGGPLGALASFEEAAVTQAVLAAVR